MISISTDDTAVKMLALKLLPIFTLKLRSVMKIMSKHCRGSLSWDNWYKCLYLLNY